MATEITFAQLRSGTRVQIGTIGCFIICSMNLIDSCEIVRTLTGKTHGIGHRTSIKLELEQIEKTNLPEWYWDSREPQLVIQGEVFIITQYETWSSTSYALGPLHCNIMLHHALKSTTNPEHTATGPKEIGHVN